MKTILTSDLALGAPTSVTLAAGPVPLTDEQLDSVTGGVSPWKTEVNPGDQPHGCNGGNPNCREVKDNPSPNN